MAKGQLARNIGPLLAAAVVGWSAVGFAKPQAKPAEPQAVGNHESIVIRDEIKRLKDKANLLKKDSDNASVISLWWRIHRLEQKLLGTGHPDTANSLSHLGMLYVSQSAYAKAEPLFLRALAIREKALGSDHSDTAISLGNLAGLYDDQGAYSKAEPLYLRALSISEKSLGPDHKDTAASLNNLALLYVNQGAYAKAEPFFLRALAITEKVLGSDHPNTATALNNLALLYVNQGAYTRAEPLYLRALSIREKTLGSDHRDTATSLNNLAGLYSNQGAYAKSELLYLRALAIREKALGSDHRDTASSLNGLGMLYVNLGDYAKAEPFFLRALSIREKVLGPDHPSLAISLNNLAGLFRRQGKYAKAELLYLRTLAIRERVLGFDNPKTRTTLKDIAGLYVKQGSFVKAESLYLRELLISEKALGPNHHATATSLNSLALLYVSQGAYAKAEPLFLRALAIREKALGSDHFDTAISLGNLAGLYQDQGAYSKAEPLYLRALSISEKSLGPDHKDTAASLNNLAMLYVNQGAYAKAEPFILRALAITEKVLGSDHPETATAVNNLALLYVNQGAYARAEPLYLRALSISEKTLGIDHADTATSLGNLAGLYNNQGAYAKAEPLYLRALEITDKVLGPYHPSTALSLRNLAGIYINQSIYSRVEPLARREILSTTIFLQRELPLLPEARRRDQQKALGNSAEVLYGIARHFANGPSLALFSRLNRHGLLQEIEQRQSLLARAPGPQRQLKEQITGLNNRLTAINLNPSQWQALQQQKAELEQQLYRLLPALQPRVVEVDQVAKALPNDGVLVEFQRYQAFDGKKPPKERWGSHRYLALIVQPSGALAAVDLGEAAPIDAATASAISATAQSQSDAEQLWATVSKLVLTPLQPHLASSAQWFLSPDGELNRVPFAALPSPVVPGKTVGDSVNLRLLTTGRDLLRFQTPVARGQAPLVMANPSFDRKGARATAAPAQQSPVSASQQRSTSLGSKTWAPLPATAVEGRQIAALLGTQPLTDAAATVQRLQSSPSPRIVHIASHGFFAADQETKPSDPLAAVMEHSQQIAGFVGEDPMLRSGLVLAGANQPEADRGDDGYLTAAEATALQLDGTELVVLSACSTGQGDIRTGEGVYGLQRALTVAGVRTTLLSLWKVDDKATAAFMEAFYTRLKGGAGRADALATTQADFRNHPNVAWRHPYYWAAWQLTGDWRPIPGL